MLCLGNRERKFIAELALKAKTPRTLALGVSRLTRGLRNSATFRVAPWNKILFVTVTTLFAANRIRVVRITEFASRSVDRSIRALLELFRLRVNGQRESREQRGRD